MRAPPPLDVDGQVSSLGGKGSFLGKVTLSLVLAAAVYLGLLLYGRGGELGAALRGFHVVYLVPIFALVLANYGLRFARWQYYLRRCGARVPWRESAAVFVSGFAMSITPARVGELLKCVLLRDEARVKMSVSVPLVVADRLADVVAVSILVAAGTLHYSAARGISLLIIAGVTVLLLILAFSPWVAQSALWLFSRRDARRTTASTDAVRQAAAIFASLLRGRALIVGTALGVLAWLAECAALYLVLGGLGSWKLTLFAATFTYGLSTLGGAVSLLPGGLGVTEVGMTTLLVLLGVAREVAVAGVLVVRLCTLWFATALGIGVYLWHRHRLSRAQALRREDAWAVREGLP